MDRLAKLFDQSVTGVTDKVRTTVTNIKRDFTRRSKKRKQEKKDKKQKKLQNKNEFEDGDVEHKYKLVCDLPNCEYHPKPNAYEDFLNTLWTPRSNRESIHSSQIMVIDEDKKTDSNVSISTDKENFIDNKLDKVKDKLSNLNDDDNLSDDKLSFCSTDKSKDSLSDDLSNNNFEDILNEKNKGVKLTLTDWENGRTTTIGEDKTNQIKNFHCNHLIKV